MVMRSTALIRKIGWLVAAMTLMLVAGAVSLVLHSVAAFAVFMVLMVVCGVAAIIVGLAAYSKMKAEQAQLMRDETYYRQRRSGGTDS